MLEMHPHPCLHPQENRSEKSGKAIPDETTSAFSHPNFTPVIGNTAGEKDHRIDDHDQV
jgi:hypothetical protein